MHQIPRPSPRSPTAANKSTTNPEKSNNSRDRPIQRNRSSVDLASYTERGVGEQTPEITRQDGPSSGQDREAAKLNQIIQVCGRIEKGDGILKLIYFQQHFHTKAALTICSSRANLPQVYSRNGDIKQNRWVSHHAIIYNPTVLPSSTDVEGHGL